MVVRADPPFNPASHSSRAGENVITSSPQPQNTLITPDVGIEQKRKEKERPTSTVYVFGDRSEKKLKVDRPDLLLDAFFLFFFFLSLSLFFL